MRLPPSVLLDEDPDLLYALLSYIEWSDKEAERLAKEAELKAKSRR